MTGLAADRSAFGTRTVHPVLEFSLVGIGVARGATQVFEAKRQHLVDASRRALLVAVVTRDRTMSALQWKTRIVVHRNGKFRLLKIGNRMTWLTAFFIRSLGELPVMSILVAIHALRKFDFVNRFRPSRGVTIGAFHASVFAE
jgi:hypothetical protein